MINTFSLNNVIFKLDLFKILTYYIIHEGDMKTRLSGYKELKVKITETKFCRVAFPKDLKK